MTKQKKKRNKVYTGVDASITRPVITHISAANRSKIGQLWFDNKRVLKPVLITTGIVILVVWFIFELVRILGA